MKIATDKIREVIGAGGKIIREIVEKTGAKINIDDEGVIKIASSSAKEIDAAKAWIHSIVDEPEVGVIYEGKVVKTVDFGAFVNILPGKDGLVHISQIASERVENVSDHLKEGEEVRVKVLDVDQRGRIKLSIKELLEDEAAEAPAQEAAE